MSRNRNIKGCDVLIYTVQNGDGKFEANIQNDNQVMGQYIY